jgi:transcriptional regulator with XRE-family HTH domain
MSQEVLSKEAGYDRTYVGKVERGESSPSLKTIQEFADILDVEAWRLLKETDDRDE